MGGKKPLLQKSFKYPSDGHSPGIGPLNRNTSEADGHGSRSLLSFFSILYLLLCPMKMDPQTDPVHFSGFSAHASPKNCPLPSQCRLLSNPLGGSRAGPWGAMGRITNPWLSVSLGEELEQRRGACSSALSGEKTKIWQGRERGVLYFRF